MTYIYSLGRAMVSAVNVDLSANRASTVESGKQATAAESTIKADTTAPAPAGQAPAASLPASDELPPADSAPAAESAASDVASATGTAHQADLGPSAPDDAAGVERVKTLGFVPAAVSQSGADGNEVLYLLLAAAGLAVVGGCTLYTRFSRH